VLKVIVAMIAGGLRRTVFVVLLLATAARADGSMTRSIPISKVAIGMKLTLARDLVIPADPVDPVYIQNGHVMSLAAVDFGSALCDFEVPAVSWHIKAGHVFTVAKTDVVGGGNMRESVALIFRGDSTVPQMNCESSRFELTLADFRDTLVQVFKVELPNPTHKP
jgi:hypothetical protein